MRLKAAHCLPIVMAGAVISLTGCLTSPASAQDGLSRRAVTNSCWAARDMAAGSPGGGAKAPQSRATPRPAAVPSMASLAPVPSGPLRGAVFSLAFSPDGSQLAVGTDGQVELFSTKDWKPKALTQQILGEARSLAYSPDGRTLAIGCGQAGQKGAVELWNLQADAKPLVLTGPKDDVESVAYSANGRSLLAAADDNTVRYYAAGPGTSPAVLDEHNDRVEAAAFSPKLLNVFITSGLDHIVKVWNATTLHTMINFDQSEAGIIGLAFLNNGSQFVGASLDGRLYWWGISYDQKKAEYQGYLFRQEMAQDGGMTAFAMSPASSYLVTAGVDGTVRLWRADGRPVAAVPALPHPAYAVALAPKLAAVAAAGMDGVVWVWDGACRVVLATLTPAAPAKARAEPLRGGRRVRARQ